MNPVRTLRDKFLKDFKDLLRDETVELNNETFCSIIRVAAMFVPQKAIADKTGYTRTSIGRWRNGECALEQQRFRALIVKDVAELLKGVE